ncbi:MAG TPA: LPXTG cell wall anchor domain-containing protein, partial [Fastidiosipila sp.]|nr:LPXTG cell wall anchor domain-containing protein [Fastidiosipila sp.]
ETIPVSSKTGDDNVPKTGESWPIGYVAGGLLLVLAGLALMLLKKNMRAGK